MRSLPPLSPLRMNPTHPTPQQSEALVSAPVVALKAAPKTRPKAAPKAAPIAAPVKNEGGVMDIFSALSLAPDAKAPSKEEPVGRSATDTSRSTSSTVLSPLKKVTQIDMKTVVAEVEKSKKRDRRKSFWRR
jgi:hypothetical protein